MPKQTKLQYRIILEIPSAGIERSLPYVFETEGQAEFAKRELNNLFYNTEYRHRVEPIISHHASSSNGKEHSYAYHGR